MRSSNSQLPFRLTFLLLASAILLGAFLLRVERLREFPPGVSADEATNVIDAAHIARYWNFPLYEETGRPEPLYRLLLALGAASYGSDVWTMRYANVLIGMISLAAAYWTATEALSFQPRAVRRAAALWGIAALAVALTHIALSRSLYRGPLQVPFMLLALGFALRGLRLRKRRDFVAAGAMLAGALYSYTAAYVVPAAFVVLALQQFLLRRPWRSWLPGLALMATVSALLWSPVILRILTTPEAVFARATDVSQQINWQRNIQGMIEQFYRLGDENPQYNVALAPIVPEAFLPLFAVGLAALVIRIRVPASPLIGALLILCSIPAVATEEVSHGLRIVGQFVVLPLVVACGAALLLHLVWRYIGIKNGAVIASILATLSLSFVAGLQARQVYADYWQYPENWQMWRIFNQTLDHNEWFFRTDHKALAKWIESREERVLLPKEILNTSTVRAWLMDSYPEISSALIEKIPANTWLVLPWSIATNDVMRGSRDFVLLNRGTITLLPPFDAETSRFIQDFVEAGPVLIEGRGRIPVLGYTKPLTEELPISYEIANMADHTFGSGEMRLLAWYGPDTLPNDTSAEVEFTLEWQALRRLGHIYWTFLQIQRQDFERISGTDQEVLRWLAPSTIWHPELQVYDTHRLTLPPLEPGAYALVAGVYPPFSRPLTVADSPNHQALLGWLKVPPRESTRIPANARRIETTFADTFLLQAMHVEELSNNQWAVKLYWKTLSHRPSIDATIFVHLVDEDGTIILQDDARPWGGQYPTLIWDEGEIVQTVHVFDRIDSSLNPRIRAGMYIFPGPVNLMTDRSGEEESFVWLGRLKEIDIAP